MSYHVIKAPLIVDPDWSFLNSLDEDPAAKSLHPWLAGDLDRALELMKTESGWISCLVINPVIGTEAVQKIMQSAFELLLGAPVFFLAEAAKTKRENESRAMVTRQLLEKPLTYSEILAWVANANETSRAKRPPRTRPRANVRDEDFRSVTIQSLLIGSSLSLDLYVKLRQDRYIRIVAAGDSLDDSRLQRYLRRGLKEFYLKKAEEETYARMCENLSAMLTAGPRPEPAVDASGAA